MTEEEFMRLPREGYKQELVEGGSSRVLPVIFMIFTFLG
jgi:hypothetical protein